METIHTFEFNIEEINVLLRGLQKLPYNQSVKLIRKVTSTIQKQQRELDITLKQNK